jgi:hypothetical protein
MSFSLPFGEGSFLGQGLYGSAGGGGSTSTAGAGAGTSWPGSTTATGPSFGQASSSTNMGSWGDPSSSKPMANGGVRLGTRSVLTVFGGKRAYAGFFEQWNYDNKLC